VGLLRYAPLSLALWACAGAPTRTAAPEPEDAHALVAPVVDRAVPLGPATWTGPWVEAPFAFDELLPSWNVRLPDGAAFRAEVQLDEAGAPWLDLGGWGEWPADDLGPTRLDGGRVAIDVIELERTARRARLRVRTRGLEGAAQAALERLTLCFTRSDRHAARTDFGTPAPVATLPVPMRHQGREAPEIASRICSPTSVTMAMAFAGVERPTAEVAATVFDAEHDIYGNWNRAVQGAFGLGVPGYLLRVNDWPEASALLAEGTPLVISIAAKEGQLAGAPYASTAGHLLVLAGFDGAGGAVVFDPATPVGGETPRRYALRDLETVWLRRGGVAYRIGGGPPR
jgi:hypothetical protein